MSEEITITLTRHKAFIMCKALATIEMDGQEIAKLKNGQSIEYKTTKGEHEFSAKAMSAFSDKKVLDLQDGDTVAVKMFGAGWIITLER